MSEVGILGGGLTGLTLCSLLENGEILERESECGGLCRSISEDGFTFDCGGSHIIFSRDRNALNFMLSKLKDNVVKCRRNTKIIYKGRLVKYPFENGLADLPLRENFECVASFLAARVKSRLLNALRSYDGGESLHAWLLANFGRGIASKYLIPYNEKIWKISAKEMSASWVDGRVPKPPLRDVLRASLGFNTEGYTHQLNFYYPKRGGIAALIRSLERECKGRIVCDFEVKAIWRENGKWFVSNGEECRRYDKIVATIPVFSIVHSLQRGGESVPASVLRAVNALVFNSLATVMLGLEGLAEEKMSNISWLYIPDADCLPHRVAFPSNYSREVAPEGKAAVLAEITCRDTTKMSDEEIIERTVNDLHRKKILRKEDVCFAKVMRTSPAYIVYDMNYEHNVSVVREYLQRKGIILAGRFAKFEYMNMDACVRNAMEVARMLKTESGNWVK